MTSIRKIDKIILTYYVNPHHFYFKYKNDPDGEQKLAAINGRVDKYVRRHIENRYSNPYLPKIGEIVLCHYISDCVYKWIRARVDTKFTYDKEKFVLWAIDYGFPLETEARWIRQLPDDLKGIENGLIFKGGLFEIVPSVVEFDFIESAAQSRKTKKWSQRAVESVEKYIHDADNITFKCRAYYEEHFFGSLIIQSNTKMVVEDFLKSLKEGVDSSNFLKEFFQLEDPPYWQRQKQDAIYKIYDNNSEFSKDAETTSFWATTDDLLNKSELKFEDLPKLLDSKSKENAGTDETLIKLSDQLENATMSSRSGRFSSLSRQMERAPGNDQSSDSLPKQCDTDGPDEAIPIIPMNKRLAVAQQKLLEEGKMAARKQAHIDELNKKVMALTFPAGFIVDNNAIEAKKKFIRDKKFSYQRAKDNEQCFSVNHVQRVLVHDHDNCPIPPIKDIREANFPNEVHTALNDLNINKIFRIQTIGWPRLLRGSSMIFVNNSKTGKTWTYLPAICALIIERILDKQVLPGCGPLSIITCATSRDVNKITQCVEDLLRYTDYGIRCFKAYGNSDEENVVIELLNGREILITTVPCLYRLIEQDLHLFDKKRINSLVFDNIDLVYEQFGREIGKIHESLCNEASDVQLIITSRRWLKILKTFFIESNRLTLCIGSYIEAAVYGKTEMTLELLGQKFKIDKLISYVSGINYPLELTLVICNTSDDVKDLLKKLQSTSIKTWIYHDKSDSDEIMEAKKWIEASKSGDFRLLICTDEILNDLDIRHAQHIIHFSLPSTWSKFTFRFSVLFDHHENVLKRQSDCKPSTTSVVFLDEHNNEELPRLIDFMQMRGNCNIPENILKLAEMKQIEKEEKRQNIYKLFCTDLMTLGVCYERLDCSYRHTITKSDRSRNAILKNGFVKMKIFSVHSPVHFTVRLLEHRFPYESKWTKLQSTDEASSFNMELLQYFEDEENHAVHSPCLLGDLCVACVVSEGGMQYERGQIVNIEEKKFMTVLSQCWVEILLIDSNQRISCNSTELMHLPDRFKNFPPQAVDVRIADLRPHDFDSEWDPEILEHVKNWIQNDNHHYCQGFVKLSIMNTLWVDSIDVIEILHSIKDEVKTTSIKKNLLERKFCVYDSKPLELMKSLAEKAGLIQSNDADSSGFPSAQIVDRRTPKDCPVFRNSDSDSSIDLDESDISLLNWTTSTDSDDPEIPNENLNNSATSSTQEQDLLRTSKDKWAELTLNQFNKVILCNFFHPNRVYIRNTNYSSRLLDLEKRIDAFTSLTNNLIKLSDIKLAANCLAKIGIRFGRAKVMKIFYDTDGNTAEVFFVDLGEFLVLPVNELFEIPKTFITALPFQAIFCKFIGVRPKDSDKWCDTICDNIFENMLVDQSHFYARSMQLGGRDKYAYGLKSRSYQVVLLDQTGMVNINNWIVDNYGDLDPDTKHFIDVVIDKNALTLLNSDCSDESDCLESNNNSMDLKPVVEDDSIDVQFDDEEILKFLQANQIPVTVPETIEEITESNEEQITPPETIEEITESDEEQRTTTIQKSIAPDCNRIKSSTELVSSHKFPKIKWHQSPTMVVLTINAPDVKDYFLKITPRLVNICFISNQEKFAAVCNLFGCIDVEYTSHEIRGLNVIVRLVKTLKNLSWPRLENEKRKNNWLKYNFEATCDESKDIDSVDEKFNMVKTISEVTQYIDDSSDDEEANEDID